MESTGSPTVSQLLAWTGHHLTEGADYWDDLAHRWERAFVEVEQRTRDGGWDGAGSDAAAERAYWDRIRVANGPVADLREAVTVARQGAADVQLAQNRFRDALTAARDAGFDVGDEYSVTDRRTGGTVAERAAREAEAQEFAQDIRYHAAQLISLDNHIAARLSQRLSQVENLVFDEHGGVPLPNRKSNGVRLVTNDTKEGPPGASDDDYSPPADEVAAWYVDWNELQREAAAHNAAVAAHLRTRPPPTNSVAVGLWNARGAELSANAERIYAKQQQLAADAVQLGIPEPTVTPPPTVDNSAQVPQSTAVPSGLISAKPTIRKAVPA